MDLCFKLISSLILPSSQKKIYYYQAHNESRPGLFFLSSPIVHKSVNGQFILFRLDSFIKIQLKLKLKLGACSEIKKH